MNRPPVSGNCWIEGRVSKSPAHGVGAADWKYWSALNEDSAMQRANKEDTGEFDEELQMAALEAIPVEKRLRGLSPEEVAAGLSDDHRRC
jgi:hypothetical protein